MRMYLLKKMNNKFLPHKAKMDSLMHSSRLLNKGINREIENKKRSTKTNKQ